MHLAEEFALPQFRRRRERRVEEMTYEAKPSQMNDFQVTKILTVLGVMCNEENMANGLLE